MSMIEENGVVVSLDGHSAKVAPLAEGGCHSCASSGVCGTTVLAPLFSKKQRLLLADNMINAQPGDEVVIGLNKMAVVMSSLAVYLLPLIALVLGAVIGDVLARLAGLEDGEIASIFSGSCAAILTFVGVRRVLQSAFFTTILQPVINSRRQQ